MRARNIHCPRRLASAGTCLLRAVRAAWGLMNSGWGSMLGLRLGGRSFRLGETRPSLLVCADVSGAGGGVDACTFDAELP